MKMKLWLITERDRKQEADYSTHPVRLPNFSELKTEAKHLTGFFFPGKKLHRTQHYA